MNTTEIETSREAWDKACEEQERLQDAAEAAEAYCDGRDVELWKRAYAAGQRAWAIFKAALAERKQWAINQNSRWS